MKDFIRNSIILNQCFMKKLVKRKVLENGKHVLWCSIVSVTDKIPIF